MRELVDNLKYIGIGFGVVVVGFVVITLLAALASYYPKAFMWLMGIIVFGPILVLLCRELGKAIYRAVERRKGYSGTRYRNYL